MSRPTRAQLSRQIEELELTLKAERLMNEKRAKEAGNRELELKHRISAEQVTRVAAQRGLVPYVRSLERFDQWLHRHPTLRKQLEPVLRELGLWEIKLGYDPDQDLVLSVISPERS